MLDVFLVIWILISTILFAYYVIIGRNEFKIIQIASIILFVLPVFLFAIYFVIDVTIIIITPFI